MKVFSYFGDSSCDYRSLMNRQQDLRIEGQPVPVQRLVILDQTHSSLVHECREEDCGAGLGDHPQIPVADGAITNIPGQFILVRTADCTPVILIDPVSLTVAAIHSGREGTRKNICAQAVLQMTEAYGCKAENIRAAIGAGICGQHYQVSLELWDEFRQTFNAAGIAPELPRERYIDIPGSIRNQLLHSGLESTNIRLAGICTYENGAYFSFRRTGTHNRQINIVGITYE